MARYGCRSLTTLEELRFTLRIDNFSMRVCKGFFIGPDFENESSDTKWSLVVSMFDGADYDNYIEVQLRRNRYVDEEQFVKAKLSVVDVFESPTQTSERELLLKGSDSAQVLTVTKERLFGNFGLNKLRFLPNDSLTVLCELVVYQDEMKTFHFLKDFENAFKTASIARSGESFARSSLVPKAFDFVQRFRNFSVYSRSSGRCVGREYQSERYPDLGKWSLAVTTCDNDFREDFLDVRLRRSGDCRRSLLVEAKLSIANRFGWNSACGTKKLWFRGGEEESLLLTLPRNRMPGWFGLNKLLVLPDDALTLHCEIIAYEEGDVEVYSREDFVAGLGNQAEALFPPWLAKYLLVLFFLVVGAWTVRLVVLWCWYVILPSILAALNSLLTFIIQFVLGVLLFVEFLYLVKSEALKIKARQNRRRRNNSDHHGSKQVQLQNAKGMYYHQSGKAFHDVPQSGKRFNGVHQRAKAVWDRNSRYVYLVKDTYYY